LSSNWKLCERREEGRFRAQGLCPSHQTSSQCSEAAAFHLQLMLLCNKRRHFIQSARSSKTRPDHFRQLQAWQICEQHDCGLAQTTQGSEAESGNDGCGVSLSERLIRPWGAFSMTMGHVAEHPFLPFIMLNHLQPLAYRMQYAKRQEWAGFPAGGSAF
jgi:hypothetical protein